MLYKTFLPIKAAKAADLKKLAMEYLPSSAARVYMDLPTVEDNLATEESVTSSDSD